MIVDRISKLDRDIELHRSFWLFMLEAIDLPARLKDLEQTLTGVFGTLSFDNALIRVAGHDAVPILLKSELIIADSQSRSRRISR